MVFDQHQQSTFKIKFCDLCFHNVDVTILDLSDFSIYISYLCVYMCVCVFHIYSYVYV